MIPKVSKMDYMLAFWIMYGLPSLAIIVLINDYFYPKF